jgi:hypothetical protein
VSRWHLEFRCQPTQGRFLLVYQLSESLWLYRSCPKCAAQWLSIWKSTRSGPIPNKLSRCVEIGLFYGAMLLPLGLFLVFDHCAYLCCLNLDCAKHEAKW